MTAFDINDYQQKANNGDAEAQYQLGLCYAKGLGVEKNFRESARYWLQASKQQHSQALVGLGKLFEKGVGVPQDYTKAYQCYHVATAQNLAEAKVRLAMLYMQGFGVEQDPKKAVQLFIQAAEQGDATAQYNLAVAYEKGLGGFVQNPEQATFWYQQSADLGYAPAVNRLAENLDKQTDNQASNVDAEAIFVNATQKIKNQLHDAMMDFQHSAEHGFAKAQYNVGIAHLFGVGGVAQNTDLAVEFLQKSAKQDFRPAHFVLGWYYQGGFNVANFQQAVNIDNTQALYHYEKAGELGHAQAQYFLAKMYETGNGVDKNDETALSWLRQSAKQGYGVAYQRLEQLIP